MSEREKVAVYVATCPKCGGGWGAISTGIPSIDVLSALAPWVIEGAEIRSYGEDERAACREAMGARCTCPESKFSHEAIADDGEWPDVSCPACGAPSSPFIDETFAENTYTCDECGSEWTRTAVLTVHRCEITKRGKLEGAGLL